MNPIAKIFYIVISSSLGILLLFCLVNFDITNNWFLPLSLIILMLLFIMAALNTNWLFLFLILIFPTAYKFNYYKIDLTQYLFSKNYGSILINPIALLYLVIITIGLIIILTNWQKIKQLPLRYIILLFTSYVILSIFWSDYKSISIIGAIYFCVPFMMYVISFVNFSGTKNLMKIIFFSVISSVIPVVSAIYQIITNNYFFEQDSSLGRLTGTFAHPNSFGLYLFVILSLIFSYYLAKKNRKIEKNILIAIYFLIITIIFILTYSRVSWVSFSIFIILFTFFENKLLLLWGSLLPIITFIILMSENIRNRIVELASLSIYSSWASRKNIWDVIWKEFMKKPLTGHGIGISETVIENSKPWRGGSSLPHNDILLHALELGITGIILFFAYTFGAIFYTFKTYVNITNKYQKVKFLGREVEINIKIFCFGVAMILLATIPSIIFESASQKIITQIIIWSILGAMFTQKNTVSQNRINTR